MMRAWYNCYFVFGPFLQKLKKIRKMLTMHNYVLIGRLTWLDQIYKKKTPTLFRSEGN